MGSGSREKILQKIQQALKVSVPAPFPELQHAEVVFSDKNEELEVQFAQNFSKLLGKFAFCENENDLAVQLARLFAAKKMSKIYCKEVSLSALLTSKQVITTSYDNLTDCDAAVTTCEALVARTGSMLLSSSTASGRTASVYAAVHICIAYTHQLVFDIKDALAMVKDKYGGDLPSLLTFATGPSRTADIEKTLVVGVHGPKEVYCFLVQSTE